MTVMNFKPESGEAPCQNQDQDQDFGFDSFVPQDNSEHLLGQILAGTLTILC